MATAFQQNAFQNPVNFDHLGFQVDSPTTSPIRALVVDQSVQLTADEWTLEHNNTEAWRARSEESAVDVSTGLVNAAGQSELVKHILEGTVDEWELHFGPDVVTARTRGRDGAAGLLDTALFISYVSGGTPVPVTPSSDLPPGLRSVPGVTERLYLPGNWTASGIITDLATRIGLVASYQAPDYTLREDVDVNGPVLDAVHRLVEPFSHFEPFKVDVLVEGKTLVVRQRQGLAESPGPMGPVPGTLNTLTIHDLRNQALDVRAHFLDHIRVVRMNGAVTGSCSELNAIDPVNEQYTIEEGGRSIRITISGTKRRIDDAELTMSKETVDIDKAQLLSRETTTHFWDALEFDSNCRVTNSPKYRGSQMVVESIGEDGLVRPTGRVTVAIVYDTLGFMVSQTTTEEALVELEFQVQKKEVKRFFDNGVKMYNEETVVFTADEDGNLAFQSKRTGPGGGHRPGGPGRAPRETMLPNTARAYVVEVVDDVPGARDFSLQNFSLTQASLDMIRDQARASSGAMEYNVEFSAANIPWLKKGQMLEITGLTYEDGVTPVELPKMLVYECHVEHVEDGPSNSYSVMNVKAVFWSKSYGRG